MEILNGKEI